MNIADVFAAHASNQPDYPAVEDGERIVAYAQLQELANCAAANLAQEGIAPGDIVALALPDTIEHVALIWALAKIGAISFPINAQLLRSEDEVGLGKHQLKAVIAVEGAPALPEDSRIFFLGKLFARAPHLEPPATAPGGEHPLCCTQSSGTTGTAKTFLKSHDQAAIAAFHSDESSLCWTAADRYLALISLSFSASSRNCLAALHAGATIILDHSELVRERIRTLQDKRVTVTILTPHHLRPLLAYVMRNERRHSAPLPPYAFHARRDGGNYRARTGGRTSPSDREFIHCLRRQRTELDRHGRPRRSGCLSRHRWPPRAGGSKRKLSI